MVSKEQALDQFWSGFGLDAYDETAVPDGTKTPYITYNVVTDSLGSPVAMSASLWYRSTSWAAITEKAKEIAAYIGRDGRRIRYDGGVLWVKRGTPFAQRMSDEDDTIRRIYINIEAEYISAD